MNAWDLVWFTVTALGLLVSLMLVWESKKDLKFATSTLRPLAITLYRHELLRCLKQLLLLVAIGLVAFRRELGDPMLINIRNGLMAAVAAVLSINSVWDLFFRTRYFRDVRAELLVHLRKDSDDTGRQRSA